MNLRFVLPRALIAAVMSVICFTVFSICGYSPQQKPSARLRAKLGNFSNSIAWEQLPFNPDDQIPMQLFQTSRSMDIGPNATTAASTWASLNPDMPRVLHDDATAARFIKEFYGGDVYAVFQALPVGVMRADFWRYAILYAYGGIYADIDVRCLQPVERWFPPRPTAAYDSAAVSPGNWTSAGPLVHGNLTWQDCSIVLGLENEASICQWTLASVPGHPVLRQTIKQIVQVFISKGYLQKKPGYFDNMVHALTGPSHFTSAVAVALQLPPGSSGADIARAAWTDPEVYKRLRQQRVCIVAQYFFGGGGAQNTLNEYGSQFYHDGTYPRWLEEVQQYRSSYESRLSSSSQKTAEDSQHRAHTSTDSRRNRSSSDSNGSTVARLRSRSRKSKYLKQ